MQILRNWLINLYYRKYSDDKNKTLNLLILVVMKIWGGYYENRINRQYRKIWEIK